MGSYLLSLLQQLEMPSLSHLVLLLTIVSLLLIAYLMRKFSVFDAIEFEKDIFPEQTVIYLNHRTHYSKMSTIFNKIVLDINGRFMISNCFGIYYDNPKQVSDEYHCRVTIGIMINVGELSKIPTFLQEHPQYKKGKLPTTTCIKGSHHYVNNLSFFIIPAKVYPKLMEYTKKNDIECCGPIIEKYNFIPTQKKQVVFYAPLQNNQGFWLWK